MKTFQYRFRGTVLSEFTLKTCQRASSVSGFNFLCLTTALATLWQFFEAIFSRSKISSFASGARRSVFPLGHMYKVSTFTRVDFTSGLMISSIIRRMNEFSARLFSGPKLSHLTVQKFVQFRRSRVNAGWKRASFCPCKICPDP